jgi:hypothetical protein
LARFADRNGNGFLSASEFPAIRRAERTFAQAELEYFDDNRDGKVSRPELVDKPSRFIGRYDRNVDCKVTAGELKAAPRRLQAAVAGRVVRRAIAYGSDLACGHLSRRPPLAGAQDEDRVRRAGLSGRRCRLASP